MIIVYIYKLTLSLLFHTQNEFYTHALNYFALRISIFH